MSIKEKTQYTAEDKIFNWIQIDCTYVGVLKD